ncbi:putative HTH-type transcriptional regulator YcgE [Ktedonobacter sp. SOSP1-52]|uniref:MarR family winged helix-turn-helix transcriptional regulator n=1 Tax=Ktedonobacter sp. SOSP1-52 TaxID=2778366 RepID=UPI0019163DBF|nr:MarR family transcriptional regulator [Ktedonobacter sp. SOSP1-52]GHO70962.1 putative HTH-type transcriptional regulator YcgE [Ktedonobacter sp. SOSP1-52]
MSSSNSTPRLEREKLIEAVINASRESSTMAVFFHSIIAERSGLGATEEKTLSLLERLGPLTAGEIAHHTGLTTPSVTSLVDRLESKGFVSRIRDTQDRRRVIVELNKTQLAEMNNVFNTLRENFHDFLDVYSDEQLATIADFLTRSVQRSHAFMANLAHKD